MYKVFGNPATGAFRVLRDLEVFEPDYTINAARPQPNDIKALNPAGKVPVRREEEHCTVVSKPIIQYLADNQALHELPS